MKLLFVTSAYPPESRGGTELHVRDMARELASRGHDVKVFVREGNSDAEEYALRREVEGGVEVLRLNNMFREASGFQWIWQNDSIDAVFARVLDEFVPDLVHVHHLTCLSTGILDVVKDRGYPLVMTLHDFWMVCPRGQRIDRDLELCETIDRVTCASCLQSLWPHFRELESHRPGVVPQALVQWDATIARRLGRCDLLLTPSEFHRDRMLEFPLPADRMEALPHGLRHDLLAAEKPLGAPVRRIGFVGTVIPTKGVHVLVEAFEALKGDDLELHIHGNAPSFHGDESYLASLERRAAGDERVHFHGAYDASQLPMILRDLDVLVVPSLWWESFCLTIREGLLAGCIVVASDLGAMREALGATGDGLLFPPGDSQELSATLQRLVDDVELADRYRNRGGGVKTMCRNADDLLDVYRRVLEGCGRDAGVVDAPALAPRTLPAAASPEELGVTVFIPTYNGGALLRRVLEQVFAQETDFDYEVLVIDSGSTDETLDILRDFPVRLIQIPNHEFNHGLTRNRAVREAKGGIVALLTQDAVPYDHTWLSTLVSNFEDPQVAGAFCHQLPRDDCNPFQKDRLDGWTKGEGERRVKQITSRADYEALSPMEKYQLIAFDDVASCVRKSVMEEIPFERRQFGEDVAWAKQAILAGWKLVMDPNAVVVHSHNNSVFYEFKRVYLDHQNLHDLVGMHLVQRFPQVFRFTLDGTRHLGRVVRRAKIPWHEKLIWWIKTPFYSLGQNLGQYLGARSVIEKKRGIWGVIDRALKKGV
ncbi:MAG TPA: glycosyltransferase [Planctomycetes bacterium]|nr:glycosyltransferase [Planctomycetota bacterium]